jgi:pimeloyl-ACP methyl ester carboxylesterase
MALPKRFGAEILNLKEDNAPEKHGFHPENSPGKYLPARDGSAVLVLQCFRWINKSIRLLKSRSEVIPSGNPAPASGSARVSPLVCGVSPRTPSNHLFRRARKSTTANLSLVATLKDLDAMNLRCRAAPFCRKISFMEKEMRTFSLALAAVAVIFTAMFSKADEFDSAGVKIHYVVQGKGEPVILIHGLYSSGRMNWDLAGTTRLLAQKFQVVTLDCRGHGQSAKPTAEGAYGTNMVEDIVRLMDHLNLQKARVAGYSMGGMIAMKLAVTHPDRVNRVVLCGMGWHKAGAPMNRFWATVDKPRFNVPPACEHSFPALAVTEAEIKAVKIPVEVIIGDHDPCREWYVEPLRPIRPDWPVHIIAGAGHLNCPGKPEFKTQLQAALE